MKRISCNIKRITSVMMSLCIAMSMCLGDVCIAFADEIKQSEISIGLVGENGEQSDDADDEQRADVEADLLNDNEPAIHVNADSEVQASLNDYTAETPSVKLVDKINAVWLMVKTLVTDEAGESTIVEKIANLREIAQQTPTGYNVMQGGCCDGERYAYFTFMQKSTGKVKIVKMEFVRNTAETEIKYVSCSEVLANISHGNDLAYFKNPLGDGKDKILIITNGDSGEKTNYVGVFDVDSMSLQAGKRIQYWKDLSECSTDGYAPDYKGKETRRTMKSLVGDHHGFSSIAYDATTNRIAAVLKTDHDLAVFRPVWNSDGTVDFKIQRYIRQNKNDKTLQGIDCDENFIYTCWSGAKNNNILQVYDWNGNKVGDRDVMKLYEIENLFHFGSGSEASFFSGFHYSYWHTYYTEEKVKVKYKKVWKKVKWKKVNGKWKYKKKKVWTYKTKIKQVEHKEIYRDAYCMSLGNLI